MADTFNTRTLANYLASLPATSGEDATLVTQGLETYSTANIVTAADLGSAAYMDVSYFALAASGALADSAVQSVTGIGFISVNNTDPKNPIVSFVGNVGAGDVVGPAAAVSGRFASFNGVTGKLIADSGFSSASFATAAQGTLAGTALQPAAIGTTVQGYSAVLAATTASFTTAKDTKLTGIATGATANAADAFLLARANHTGTQAAGTITGLATVATTGVYADLTAKPTLGTLAAKNQIAVPADISATGTASATTYLRGDGSWATPAGGGGGGGTVNTVVAGTGIAVNSADAANPIVALSSGAQTSLGKADSALQAAAIGVTIQGYSAVLQATTASYTTALDTKLSGIAAGAEVNVNADWNAGSGDAQILNKPTLGTAAATNSTDYATAAQGTLAGTALQPAAIGVSVQAYDADLTTWAGITPGTGIGTFLATPSSANLRNAITDESGTGSLLFANGALGTPASGTLTNATGLPIIAGTTGTLTVARGGTGVATLTGIVKAAGTANFAAAVAGTDYYAPGGTDVSVVDGGTGLSTLTANNLIVGNGTSAPTFIAPGTSGNLLTSNGTTWVSAPDAGGGGWTSLGTLSTASGTAVTFSSIPTTYRMLVVEFLGVSVSTNIPILYAVSDDGTNFTAAQSATGSTVASRSYSGPFFIYNTGLTGASKIGEAQIVDSVGGYLVSTPSGTDPAEGGPTVAVRMSVASGAFDAGSMTLWGVK